MIRVIRKDKKLKKKHHFRKTESWTQQVVLSFMRIKQAVKTHYYETYGRLIKLSKGVFFLDGDETNLRPMIFERLLRKD